MSEIDSALFLKPVTELNFSTRIQNALDDLRVMFVGELCETKEYTLRRTRNLGDKSVQAIRGKLAEMGLSLGMEIDAKTSSLIADKRREQEVTLLDDIEKRRQASFRTMEYYRQNPEKYKEQRRANKELIRERQESDIAAFNKSRYKKYKDAVIVYCRDFCTSNKEKNYGYWKKHIVCSQEDCPLYAFKNGNPARIILGKKYNHITLANRRAGVATLAKKKELFHFIKGG